MEDNKSGNQKKTTKTTNSLDPLRAPVAYVKGVGEKYAALLANLGVWRAFDLLFFFPRDYQEITLKRNTDELVEGEIQSVLGKIDDYTTTFSRIGPIVSLFLDVGNDRVKANWFNIAYIANSFAYGRKLIMTGAPKKKNGFWTFTHPTLLYLDDSAGESCGDDDDFALDELKVLPVYRLTEGITAFRMRKFVKNALSVLPDLLQEALPKDLLKKRDLLGIADAIRKIHFPNSIDEARYARRRFVYQELLVLQLAIAICRMRRRVNMKAIVLPRSAKIDSRIRSLFPFDLTDAQTNAIREITDDMGKPTPMNRLLQGDVGAGKTVVAIYAALQAVANGAQAVLMAPTEVLARQHMRTLQNYLRNSSTKIVPLFGGQKANERAEILRQIKSGEAQIIVGTQALVCNEIEFHRLGLVIIDEQHKFGVKQRAMLKAAPDLEPHYLVMTATPIPRSLTMTLFGDLDVSLMKSAPPGRKKTTTSVLTPQNRQSWWDFVRKRLDEGRQAYVVVPRVDDGKGDSALGLFDGSELKKLENDGSLSEDFDFWNNWEGPEKERAYLREMKKNEGASDGLEDEQNEQKLKTVWTVYKELSEGELKKYRLGVVHGRMTTQEKEAVMLDFRTGAIQVLIATSVVEVGVDVPNATIMTIENAERFGLAQLHQLRGRITRGKFPGFCAVAPTYWPTLELENCNVSKGKKNKKNELKNTKRSKKAKKNDVESDESTAEQKRRAEAMQRLEFFAQTTNGFELAEKDFALRGPGELFGARQHGAASLRVADLARDRDVLDDACKDARDIVGSDPGLNEKEHAALRKQVLAKYGRQMELGDVG